MGQRRDGDRIEMWDTAEDLNQEYVLKEPKPPFYKHAAYELAKWILLTVVLFLVPVPWYYKIFVGLGLFAIGMIPKIGRAHV